MNNWIINNGNTLTFLKGHNLALEAKYGSQNKVIKKNFQSYNFKIEDITKVESITQH